VGIYVFSFVKFSKNPKKLVLINVSLFIVFSSLSFVFIRNIRNFSHVPIGDDISLKSTILLIFAALSRVNFLEGIFIRSIIRLIKSKNAKSSSLKNFARYIGAGAILGCLLYFLFLFQFLGIKILSLAYALLILNLLTLIESKLKILLYGALGAWIASLIGGGFLILVWGMEKSILFIAALKFLILCRRADLTKMGL